jgi:hypothetical protein
MKSRVVIILQWAASLGLPALLGGCTTESLSATAVAQNVQTFLTDFGLQMLTALLL